MIKYDGLINRDLFQKEINSEHKSNKKLSYKELNNCVVLPIKVKNGKSFGGIVDSGKNFVNESTIHYGSHEPYYVEEKEIKNRNESVIYFGMLIGVWGHCITDCIKRAWFFNKENKGKHKIVYIAHEGSLHKNFIEFLKEINIDITDFEEIREPTRFKKIILPDESFYFDNNKTGFYSDEYVNSINIIKSKYQKPNELINKKLFFSHKDVRGINNDIGEEKIEKYLEKNGFEIVHPEKLSFAKEMDLLSRCKVFAATDGSTSHNSIFLPNKSKVVIIPRSPHLTQHQLVLNDIYKEQDIEYVDSSLSILCNAKRPTRGPFFYYVSKQLVKCIENKDLIISERYLQYNFKDFEKYLKNAFYIDENMKFTAYQPYVELAFELYNKYLYTKKVKRINTLIIRKIQKQIIRIKKQ